MFTTWKITGGWPWKPHEATQIHTAFVLCCEYIQTESRIPKAKRAISKTASNARGLDAAFDTIMNRR